MQTLHEPAMDERLKIFLDVCVCVFAGCSQRLDSFEIQLAVCASNTNSDCSPLLGRPPARRMLCVLFSFIHRRPFCVLLYEKGERTRARARATDAKHSWSPMLYVSFLLHLNLHLVKGKQLRLPKNFCMELSIY